MASNVTELIIKVGKKSTLSFSHSTAYRVVTYDELVETSRLLPDCNMLIIEGIFDDEYDNIKNFVDNYLKADKNNKVWFYTDDVNDENINGLVDELACDIFMSKESLFRNIFELTKLNISTDIKLRKELNTQIEVKDDFSGFDINFGEELEGEDAGLEEVDPEIVSKITTDNANTVEEIDDIPNEIVEDILITEKEEAELPKEDALIDEPKKPKVNIGKATEDKKDLVKDVSVSASDKLNAELAEKVKQYELAVDNLNTKINSLIKDNKTLESKLKQGNTQIESLSKLNKSITDKYNIVIAEYNAIINSDEIIEDPIPLTEYNGLKIEIKSLKTQMKEQKEDSERENQELSWQIDELNDQIKDLKANLDRSEKLLEDKKSEMELLNTQIANGELQSEELEDAKRQIVTLNSDIEDLEIVIKGQTKDITNLREKIDESSDKVEKENFGRQSSVEFSNLLVKKLALMNEELTNLRIENEQHRESISNLRSSDKGNNAVIESQGAEIIALRKQLTDVNKQIEEAISNERYEKSLLSKQLEILQQDFDFQKEQLEFKESQYNKLRAVTTLDENGANVLEEDNKTLRDINNALRAQLKTAQEETDKVRQEKVKEQQIKHMLEDQVSNMKASIRSLQVGMSGGVTQSASLPTINYQGRGTIIGVFGCGSYGTTITAISLAKRLAMTSKVLYIDLDLLAPKSDAFFNLPPILREVPGYNDKNSRIYTGMGLFFEQGMNTLIQYHEKCVIHVEPLRRGGLDYLGGVYHKLDPVKVLSADFGQLLNYYGNMYNNVVIDLGRIGASDLSDKVIKTISDASIKTVGVTSADVIDIRLLRMKMMDAKINLNKVAVLVNMSDSSKLDAKATKFITPSLYGIMPFYSDLYGNRRETFIERRSRDKFDHFISNVVFRN